MSVNALLPKNLCDTAAELIFNAHRLQPEGIAALVKNLSAQWAEERSETLPQPLQDQCVSTLVAMKRPINPHDVVTTELFQKIYQKPFKQDEQELEAQALQTVQAAKIRFQSVALTTQEEHKVITWYAGFIKQGSFNHESEEFNALLKDVREALEQGAMNQVDLELMMNLTYMTLKGDHLAPKQLHRDEALALAGRCVQLLAQHPDRYHAAKQLFQAMPAK